MIYSVAMQRRDCGFKEQLVLVLFAGVALEDEVGWFTGGDKFSAELGTKGFKLCFLDSTQGIFVYTFTRHPPCFGIGKRVLLTEHSPVFPKPTPGGLNRKAYDSRKIPMA